MRANRLPSKKKKTKKKLFTLYFKGVPVVLPRGVPARTPCVALSADFVRTLDSE